MLDLLRVLLGLGGQKSTISLLLEMRSRRASWGWWVGVRAKPS